MYKKVLYTLLMCIFIIGCAEEPIEEPEGDLPPPPPPPTPEEIAGKIINDLQLNGPPPAAGASVPPDIANRMKATMSSQKANLSATEDGKMALVIVGHKVDSRVRQSNNNESWAFVLLYTDLHIVLNPGSKKFNAERIRAVAELSRPIVVIKGILHDGTTNRPLARLAITLPLENRTVTETMKEGDELYNIRFIEVIGNSQGIVFEYVTTGDTFDVLTRNASR